MIDGTWAHAHTLHRDNAWLQRLPRYGLQPEQPGRYRIRREPERGCLSTIEAIAQALHILEPDTPGIDGLIGAFDQMIDVQIEHAAIRHAGARKRTRTTATPRLPRALVDSPERIVLLYGESSRPPKRWRGEGRELVQWAAYFGRGGVSSGDWQVTTAEAGEEEAATITHLGT